jgi:hypothetical protein
VPHCLKAIKMHNDSRTNDVLGLIIKLAKKYLRILEMKKQKLGESSATIDTIISTKATKT